MKRYCLIERKDRQGKFYCHDQATGKRKSLRTSSRQDAQRIIDAKNEALRQPFVNLQIAKAFLFGADEKITKRTWGDVFSSIIQTRNGPTQERWIRAEREEPFKMIRSKTLIETTAEDFLNVLNAGTVSTNVHLRKLHNFALDMDWLPKAIMPKSQWPEIRYGEKRAITLEEHRKIVLVEQNRERRAFYELCWHLGGSQSDIATLKAEDIDWKQKTLAYCRKKTATPALIQLGSQVIEILKDLPSEGSLFPQFSTLSAGHRATEFQRKLKQAGILNRKGLTLHSYRYALAERARVAGMPERQAMEILGHNSLAVHRAYAKRARMTVVSLEEYERRMQQTLVTGCNPDLER